MLRARAGAFVVEIGYDQKDAVEALFNAAGANDVWTIKDLSTRDRGGRYEKPLGNPRLNRYSLCPVSTQFAGARG